MSPKQRTKDEKYVIVLYETALQTGNVNASLNRYDVGSKAGLHPKAVDTICKLLIQANFIKKNGEVDIYLTSHGEALALRLLDEV